jgi:tRNA dimethylallyltransferase
VLPIIVGGSGFYLKSLFFPPHQTAVPETQDIGAVLNKNRENKESKSWDTLYEHDPARAQALDPADTYRIERALELVQAGTLPSLHAPVYTDLGADVLCVWLERDRQELYQRINQRVQIMMDAGWLQETQALIGTAWEQFLLHKKIIGYDLLMQYSTQDTDQSLLAIQESIAQKTRNYAKRQHTFWRMLKKMLAPHLHAPSELIEISLSSQDGYTSLATVVNRFIKEAA